MNQPADLPGPPIWGGQPQMSAWEGTMWRADGTPRTRSTGVIVEILASTPVWSDLLALYDQLTREIPRLRDRVLTPSLPVDAPVWSPDPQFDLGYHVQRVVLPQPASMRTLLDLTAHVIVRPLDRQRPPWELTLVEGLPEGRAACLFKVHHSMSDGLGLMQLIEATHERTGAPRAPLHGTPVSGTPTVRGRGDLARRQVSAHVADLPARVIRGGGAGMEAARRTAFDPRGIARSVRDYGSSLRRTILAPPIGRSPLLAHGGTQCVLLAHEVPLDALRRAGKDAGGSLNDAFVAGVLGCLRQYHDQMGTPVERIPLAFPISTRRPGDPAGGNRFAGARVAAPIGERDPVARIRQMAQLTRAARDEPAVGFLGLLAPALSRLPKPLLTAVTGQLMSASDVQLSNIRGPETAVYLAGARVERIFPMGPRPGLPAMVTLVSYDGVCCIGATVDPDAFTDLTLLEECLTTGFAEVLGA